MDEHKETAEGDQLKPESYTQGKGNHSHRVVVLLFHHYSQPLQACNKNYLDIACTLNKMTYF